MCRNPNKTDICTTAFQTVENIGPKLKGTTVFFNENLTKKNAEMAKKARELKKAGKIKSTWTANCKILIRTNGETPEEMKTVLVKSMEDLDKFND